ncbi:UvrD-helicase domain-containing protein [Herbaspirillum sp. WKF16]|uniref:UvrD-helicase domain-containing protein n=1 Tax=Herbaspirillum sp. WKF16 TaxID=3028312 RepID=UPI0023A98DE7|nr:UvrD-helicase domain-containing protein [Herbaspirillum sp. WKF16]WDZ95769.1 UvrD-helicase domain-containing protein [Herbaspirillum sp. WKF16]
MEIEITEEDIAFAESILLAPGASFDEERRAFIKNLSTLDLQAVPGSGKTTALLAKLLILDRYMPFADGSGILVISHTNAAMDEIKNRIGLHCTKLFRYPNFVGTIQSFVDEFLAIPFFISKYKHPPVRIDDDLYDQQFSRPPFYLDKFSKQENKNARYFLLLNRYAIRWSFLDGSAKLTNGLRGPMIDFKKPKGKTAKEKYQDWSTTEKGRVQSWISNFKTKILKAGYLSFDDAYFLADAFVHKHPGVKQLLQKRFSMVFVDEMQDMKPHQYGILEDVFFNGGASQSAYQRIGDKNQSIYDGRTETEQFWIDREVVLHLNGSHRLSRMVATLVSRFAVSSIRIDGRAKGKDGNDIPIKPHMIVFPADKVEAVIPRFATLVKSFVEAGSIPDDPCNKYKAVGWVAKREKGKLRLCNYFPGYTRVDSKRRMDHTSLESYFDHDNRDRNISPVERNICNALLRILREEHIFDENGNPFSKRRMFAFLMEARPDYLQLFRSKLYDWCMNVVRGKKSEALSEFKAHLPEFLVQFNGVINHSAPFISAPAAATTSSQIASLDTCNMLQHDGVTVEISTIHGVKGETHTATLYLETYYEKGQGGNFESERLADQLKGNTIKATAHNLVKQSSKMVYVGFSRPTHLLCLAVQEARFEKIKKDLDENAWEIVWC